MGNPTSYLGKDMTWDIDGNLTSVGDSIQYTYDSDGIRTSKTVNGKKTVYNYSNGLLISETCGDETLKYTYDAQRNAVEIRYIGVDESNKKIEKMYFFTRNLQGDIIGVYDAASSKLVGTYSYDAWGKPLDENGTEAPPVKNVSSDPYQIPSKARNGGNCDNNPVMRVDANGKFWNEIGSLQLSSSEQSSIGNSKTRVVILLSHIQIVVHHLEKELLKKYGKMPRDQMDLLEIPILVK